MDVYRYLHVVNMLIMYACVFVSRCMSLCILGSPVSITLLSRVLLHHSLSYCLHVGSVTKVGANIVAIKLQ